MNLYTTQLVTGLHIGGASMAMDAPRLRAECFRTLVLCAEELQLEGYDHGGIEVLRCKLDDSGAPLRPHELPSANEMAGKVYRRILDGRRVVVTCMAGRNRSALVCALAIRRLRWCTGKEARLYVQARRMNSLTNPHFAAYLDSLPVPHLPPDALHRPVPR